MSNSNQTATFAAGCFWCTEAIFKRLKGVESVVSGYTGGNVENPSYEQVCMGTTHHAEAIQITFDPGVISFQKLVEIFFRTHNPTTLNRQGADVGEQYRSAIFYHDEEQKKIAEEGKTKLEQERMFDQPIVTEIIQFKEFFPAEDYHQEYYEKNESKPYCTLVIDPKIHKLLQEFAPEVKEEYR